MTATTKPTILFVHGSWHGPAHLARFRAALEAAGYPTSCPALPSVGALPPVGLAEDAACVRAELDRLVAREERNVVAVLHSYGGVVGAQTIDADDFGKRARTAAGKQGGVVWLVAVCAVLPEEGKSLWSAIGLETAPPKVQTAGDGTCMMLEPERRFYNDLPPAEQAHWTSLLQPQTAAAQPTPVTYAAYLHYPVTFLLCENDEAFPLKMQKKIVESARARGAQIDTVSYDAGRSPFLSQPQMLVELIEKLTA